MGSPNTTACPIAQFFSLAVWLHWSLVYVIPFRVLAQLSNLDFLKRTMPKPKYWSPLQGSGYGKKLRKTAGL